MNIQQITAKSNPKVWAILQPPEPKPTIVLKRDLAANSWTATDTDPRTFELFGTNTLATAFTASAPASRVLSEIRALNPGASVVLADDALSNDLLYELTGLAHPIL